MPRVPDLRQTCLFLLKRKIPFCSNHWSKEATAAIPIVFAIGGDAISLSPRY